MHGVYYTSYGVNSTKVNTKLVHIKDIYTEDEIFPDVPASHAIQVRAITIAC